jgi:hypothetical protein
MGGSGGTAYRNSAPACKVSRMTFAPRIVVGANACTGESAIATELVSYRMWVFERVRSSAVTAS